MEVIGVAGRDEVERFEEFVERHDLHHVRHIADVEGEVWRRFGIPAQPAWVLIDVDSGETETVFGSLGEEGLRERFANEP